MNPVIGVLAMQGAFFEHCRALSSLGATCVELRNLADLSAVSLDGLVLPGGESTVMGKLLRSLGLFEPLQQQIQGGLPVLGTCAGMILLAKQLVDDPLVHFGCMDILVRRNAYGRQLGSFHTTSAFGDVGKIEMTFIRGPYIQSVGAEVETLSTVNGHIVAARQHNMLVTSFHPELTANLAVHRYFLEMVATHRKQQTERSPS